MLVIMLTAMYMMVRAAESLGVRWARQPDTLPYLLSQPLPWQVHSVSHSRRSSRQDEFDGPRRNSMGAYRKNFFPNATMAATLAVPCLLSCLDIDESNGQPVAPPSLVQADKAAATIQNQYRKYQQKKHKDAK